MRQYERSTVEPSAKERAVAFECGSDQLVGILHEPASPSEIGLLVVVGGPQYRVGSNRLFVKLARRATASRISVLRFDHRGVGDSQGEPRPYYDLGQDIRAAVDYFLAECPAVKRLVLWGLCDGASAALLYARRDPRINGLVLVNPWIKSTRAHARSKLTQYYRRRLFGIDIWLQVFSGQIRAGRSIREFAANLTTALRSGRHSTPGAPSPDFLATELAATARPALFVLSGSDQTAVAFQSAINSSRAWKRALRRNLTRPVIIDDADHTFSRAIFANRAMDTTIEWLRAVR